MPRQLPHVCILRDGRRVPFTVLSRPDEPFYFVRFRTPEGRRVEKSTKEANRKRAVEAAHQKIKEVYEPEVVPARVTWDEAIDLLKGGMAASKLRPKTVKGYVETLSQLRNVFPGTAGPLDITPALAKQFKARYGAGAFSRKRKVKEGEKAPTYARSATTLDSRLGTLTAIWGKWFIRELEICGANPWADVEPPKLDRPAVRSLGTEEVRQFFAWLHERWPGWPLPTLCFTVKGMTGCRLMDLCSLRSGQLQDGRIVFPADEAKGRKERKAKLPADLYARLRGQAGAVYLWEGFPARLKELLTVKGHPTHRLKPDFDPRRLYFWLGAEISDYRRAFPDRDRFGTHGFRRRAFTEAWRMGIQPHKAAIAFGCNVQTMMRHYVALDETATADEVLDAVADRLSVPQPGGGGSGGEG